MQLYHSQEEGHLRLAIACLSYLLHSIPPTPLGGRKPPLRLIQPDILIVSQKYPLLKYASCFWLWHIERIGDRYCLTTATQSATRLLQLVAKFTTSRNTILTWLESAYLYQDPPSWMPLSHLHSWVCNTSYQSSMWRDGALAETLARFVTDLQTIQSNHDAVLRYDPQEVWSGVTDFLPKGGTLNNNLENFKECTPQDPFGQSEGDSDMTGDSSAPVITYSESSSDGKVLGVCSVWVSRYSNPHLPQ